MISLPIIGKINNGYIQTETSFVVYNPDEMEYIFMDAGRYKIDDLVSKYFEPLGIPPLFINGEIYKH